MASNMLHACVLLAALVAGDGFLMPNLMNKPLRFAVSLLDGQDVPSQPSTVPAPITAPSSYDRSQFSQTSTIPTMPPDASNETGKIRQKVRAQKKWKSDGGHSSRNRFVNRSSNRPVAHVSAFKVSTLSSFEGKGKYGASQYRNRKPGFAGTSRYSKNWGKHSLSVRGRSEEENRDGQQKEIKIVKAVVARNFRGPQEKNRQHDEDVMIIAKRLPAKKYRQFKNDYLAGSQVTSGEITSGQVTSGEVTSGEVTTGEVTSGEVTSGEVTSGEVTSAESRWNYRDGRNKLNRVKAVAVRKLGSSQNIVSRGSVTVRRNKLSHHQPGLVRKPNGDGDDPEIIHKFGQFRQRPCAWCPSG